MTRKRGFGIPLALSIADLGFRDFYSCKSYETKGIFSDLYDFQYKYLFIYENFLPLETLENTRIAVLRHIFTLLSQPDAPDSDTSLMHVHYVG